jgi:hypothetical protein
MFSKEIKKNKIVGWKVRDFEVPLVRQEQEDKKNIPQLDKFDFASKHIDWFRIVYKTAPSVEDFFVFSGDSLTMKKANITSKVDEILGLITKAKIEKKDYNKTPINIRPNIEFCVLELKLSNYDFKLYREFEISLVSSGDSKTMEEYGGYLVVRHSGSFRYFIKTNDNPTIVDKIIELRKMIF